MIEITTPQELLDFLFLNDTENNAAMLKNDIDFADYGQITTTVTIPRNEKLLDLSGFSIINLYPILISAFKPFDNVTSKIITISNGYIKNLLISHGTMIYDIVSPSTKTATYNSLFGIVGKWIFKNVGFSLLGCAFYDKDSYYTSLVSASICPTYSNNVFFEFQNCSFYIKTRNTLPMASLATFKNCSFQFDSEYSSVSAFFSDKTTYKNNLFYFCVIKGKIKKTTDFARSNLAHSNTLGHLIGCYVDVETDIPDLFISVKLSKTPEYYAAIERNPLAAISASMEFGGDSVYNADTYTATVQEGETSACIIGGQALTTAQMHDADYLLQCGFLAIDDGGDTT